MSSKYVALAIVPLFCASTALANEIIVDGNPFPPIDGTTTNGSTLSVGPNTAGNTVDIINGGEMNITNTVEIGLDHANNQVNVSGAGSKLWVGKSMTVGESAPGTTLNSTDGALISIGNQGTSGYDGIVIGSEDGSAELSAASGSKINTSNISMGTTTNASGRITLSGQDTELNVSGSVLIGEYGSSNVLSVGNHSSLMVSNDLQVGSAYGVSNRLEVLSNGKATILGDVSATNSEDGNEIVLARNSTLEVGGTLSYGELDSGASIVLDNNLNTNKTAAWNNANLNIGNSTGNNTLRIENGAQASATESASLGKKSAQNTITIDGSNSTFSVSNFLTIGSNNQGTGNQLKITDGGTNTVGKALYLGLNDGATGNRILVSGTNSHLNVGENLDVGTRASSNTLTVEDTATVSAQSISLGLEDGANKNKLYVKNNDTELSTTTLIVGLEGNSNEAHLESGAKIITSNVVVGGGTNAVGNIFTVADSNSTLVVSDTLKINEQGAGNRFVISDMGSVATSNLVVGGNTSSNGYLKVTGEGTVLSADNANIVGAKNKLIAEDNGSIRMGNMDDASTPVHNEGVIAVGTSLNINDGAIAESGAGYLGIMSNDTASVTVSGSNAAWNVSDTLVIGHGSGTNQLNVQIGGTVDAANIVIGEETDRNAIYVEDDDSTLVANEITIGSENSVGNKLNIADGGTVEVTTLNMDTNNVVNLNDGGTLFITSDFDLHKAETNGLNVASGSALKVSGELTATNVIEGGRTMGLSGSEAKWNTESNLVIGATTSDNGFTLEDGAIFTQTNVTVGASSNSHNNVLTITGTGSKLETEVLTLGVDGSTNNTLNVVSGGILEVTDTFSIASNNVVNIKDDGELLSQGDFDASVSIDGVNFGTNAVLTIGGELKMATNNYTITKGQKIKLDGALNPDKTAMWSIDELTLGNTNTYGRLEIESGAWVTNVLASTGMNSSSNIASVNGAGSMWTISSNLTFGAGSGFDNSLTVSDGAQLVIGNNLTLDGATNNLLVSGTDSMMEIMNNLTISGTTNTLSIVEEATMSVGNDLDLNGNNLLVIGTGSTINVAGNYDQEEESILEIHASKNDHGLLNVESNATFATDTTIRVRDIGDDIGASNRFSYTIIDAGSLTFGTSSNTTDDINFYFMGALAGATNYVAGNSLVIEGLSPTMAALIGVDGSGTQLEAVSDEIDTIDNEQSETMYSTLNKIVSDSDNPAAGEAVMDNYYGEKSSSAPAHNVINLGMQSVADQLTKRADNTRSRLGSASAAIHWNNPTGVAGPHESEQELQGWANAYGTRGSQSASDGFNSYDSSVSGFMLGTDFSVAENILMGVAGGSGRGSIEKDNQASSDTDTIYAALYGSAGTKDWFADASLIYGTSDINNKLGQTFDTTADYKAQNIALYFGGGKEILTDYLIVTPQASLLGNIYMQDSYEENSTDAVGRSVDSFSTLYLQSALGCSVGMYSSIGNVTFKPELRLHWLHEWLGSEETLNYQLIGGTGQYAMNLQAPEKDILKIGIGSAIKFGEYLELRADLDTRRSSNYSDTTLLGSIRYQF